MNRLEAFQYGFRQLERHQCPDSQPLRETQALLEHVLQLDAAELNADQQRPLTAEQETDYRRLIDRRLQHEPLAYLLGTAPFLDFELTITPDTLIPRPATELLAQAALAELRADPERLVLDIGSGSGCLAIAAARTGCRQPVIAIDRSAAALAVAQQNAEELLSETAEAIQFRQGDLLEPAWSELVASDSVLLMANLPYLPDSLWEKMPPEITEHEPRTALTSGPDGLDHYRRLTEQLQLLPKGQALALFLELLPNQYRPLADLVRLELGLEARPIVNHQGQTIGLAACSSQA